MNNLGNTAGTGVLAYKFSTDQSIHWANPYALDMMNPARMQNYDGTIPAVPHLHGGEVPSELDGGPAAWFTSDGAIKGHGFYSKDGAAATNHAIYSYPNKQEGAPLWFHDHTLGATRLNVYAGLAGAYLLTDKAKDPGNLPPLVPLAIQDRMFDINGELYFPNVGINMEHPYWIPEFIGDTIVVNGKTWPYVNVEPKRYTFLFLNGSNARAYELYLVNPVTKVMGPPMWQIGTDGGYLDTAVKIDPNAVAFNKLLLLPGERATVIIDFAGLAPGTQLIMRNTARAPYPKGAPANGATVGQIVQFRVIPPTGTDASYNPAVTPTLRAPMTRLVNPATGTLAPGVTQNLRRQLTLNEVMGMGGPLEILVNNTKWSGADPTDMTGMTSANPDFSVGPNPKLDNMGMPTFYSELPQEGATEVWEIINLTADAHPIHLHLAQFQLLNRQAFNANKYNGAYAAAFPGLAYIPAYGPPLPYNSTAAPAAGPGTVGGNPDVTPFLQGKPRPPELNEAGWKDTVVMYPGEVTRIAVRWAPTDVPVTALPADLVYPFNPTGALGYVWHCHIIDHEDNEMMRPTQILGVAGATRSYVKGTDY